MSHPIKQTCSVCGQLWLGSHVCPNTVRDWTTPMMPEFKQPTPQDEIATLRERLAAAERERDEARMVAANGNKYVEELTAIIEELKAVQPVAIPEGWKLERDDGVILVRHDEIGGYVARENSDNIASTILYHLADAMLSAAPEVKP